MTSRSATSDRIYVPFKPRPVFARKSQQQVKAPQSEKTLQHSEHIEVPPPGSKKKLRQSCNNCALSKVRCSKDQPVCIRCEDRGLLCGYSLSRRTGKRCPSSSSSSSENTDSTTITLETITTFDKSPIFDVQHAGHHLLPEDGRGYELFEFSRSGSISKSISPTCAYTPIVKRSYPDIQSTRMFDNDLMNCDDGVLCTNFDGSVVKTPRFDNSMGASANFISSSNLDVNMPGYSNNIIPSQSSNDPTASIFDIMGPETVTRTVITMSPISKPQDYHRLGRNAGTIEEPAPIDLQYSDFHPNSQDCTILTLNMLQSLHLPPSNCQIIHPTMRRAQSLPHPQSMLSLSNIDDIITTNKVIIDSMTNIVLCQCSLDTELTLILTLIASKIVERYIPVASCDWETHLQRQDPFSTESYFGYYIEKMNTHTSASVGKIHLNAVNMRKMRAQLVLNELHRVSQLVEQLYKRSGGSANGGSNIVAQNPVSACCRPRNCNVVGDLVASFRDQMTALTKEMMEVLRER